MATKRKATKRTAKRNAKAKDLTARGNPKGGSLMRYEALKAVAQNLRG